MNLSPDYREAVKIALVLQCFTLLSLSTILDGGNLLGVGTVAAIGLWVGALLVVLRRPARPSAVDLLYVRWGYLGLLLVAFACLPFEGALRR